MTEAPNPTPEPTEELEHVLRCSANFYDSLATAIGESVEISSRTWTACRRKRPIAARRQT